MDPRNQTFVIAGSNGVANTTIWMAAIDQRRVALANVCISYGVQLGLCLMMLLTFLTLIPPGRLSRKPIHAVHLASLVVAVVRLTLLMMYFPGPLSEYYIVWTRDPSVLEPSDYYIHISGVSFNPPQWALIETALILQTWGLMKTWPSRWRRAVQVASLVLAVATVVVKSIWAAHYVQALRHSIVPIPLDAVGEAGTVLGAISIFFFCGIFFLNLCLHLRITRGILQRPGRGLSSLEILTIGNGTLMVLPSLDIAAGLANTRVLPFDAGSWVMTFVVIGLPLIGLIARFRAPDSSQRQSRHRISLFANLPLHERGKMMMMHYPGDDPEHGSPGHHASLANDDDALSKSDRRSSRRDPDDAERTLHFDDSEPELEPSVRPLSSASRGREDTDGNRVQTAG